MSDFTDLGGSYDDVVDVLWGGAAPVSSFAEQVKAFRKRYDGLDNVQIEILRKGTEPKGEYDRHTIQISGNERKMVDCMQKMGIGYFSHDGKRFVYDSSVCNEIDMNDDSATRSRQLMRQIRTFKEYNPRMGFASAWNIRNWYIKKVAFPCVRKSEVHLSRLDDKRDIFHVIKNVKLGTSKEDFYVLLDNKGYFNPKLQGDADLFYVPAFPHKSKYSFNKLSRAERKVFQCIIGPKDRRLPSAFAKDSEAVNAPQNAIYGGGEDEELQAKKEKLEKEIADFRKVKQTDIVTRKIEEREKELQTIEGQIQRRTYLKKLGDELFSNNQEASAEDKNDGDEEYTPDSESGSIFDEGDDTPSGDGNPGSGPGGNGSGDRVSTKDARATYLDFEDYWLTFADGPVNNRTIYTTVDLGLMGQLFYKNFTEFLETKRRVQSRRAARPVEKELRDCYLPDGRKLTGNESFAKLEGRMATTSALFVEIMQMIDARNGSLTGSQYVGTTDRFPANRWPILPSAIYPWADSINRFAQLTARQVRERGREQFMEVFQDAIEPYRELMKDQYDRPIAQGGLKEVQNREKNVLDRILVEVTSECMDLVNRNPHVRSAKDLENIATSDKRFMTRVRNIEGFDSLEENIKKDLTPQNLCKIIVAGDHTAMGISKMLDETFIQSRGAQKPLIQTEPKDPIFDGIRSLQKASRAKTERSMRPVRDIARGVISG